MEEQKKHIIEHVRNQKSQGQSVTGILKDLSIKRSTYYSWVGPKKDTPVKKRTMELTPREKAAIEKTKEEYPVLHYRQIQGIPQNRGFYLSPSSV